MSTRSLLQTPLFARLAESRRVLVAGAGGGFDVVSGLPIALGLAAAGKTVHLANLTFTYLGSTDARPLAPALHEVRSFSTGAPKYFPEKHLASWLHARGLDDRIFCFEKTGVAALRRAYAWLAAQLRLDAVVLVDGGTDILMHGDEAGLGTPAEDVTSLLAARSLELPVKLLACVGFGIDAFHGVCHADFLENVAALSRAGAFHGAFSLVPGTAEVDAWLEAVDHVQRCTPERESIVCAQLSDAVRGRFGNHHSVERTRQSGTELFINPLMGLVWSFDLEAVAARCLYADALAHTEDIFDVSAIIEAFRGQTRPRPRRVIPV
jgi:hypothetical protein